MTHIRVNSSCFGFGRSFSENELLLISEQVGAGCVTREQARELILAGRAHRVAPPSAPARPLSVETAQASSDAESAAAKPVRARRVKSP